MPAEVRIAPVLFGQCVKLDRVTVLTIDIVELATEIAAIA